MKLIKYSCFGKNIDFTTKTKEFRSTLAAEKLLGADKYLIRVERIVI